MKVSTKGRYGLRAMIDLAVHSKGEKVSLCSIAERQCISENYLEQVFAILRKTALVKSVKGAQGGYILAQDPQNIKLGDILRALEGELSVVDSKNQGILSGDNRLSICIQNCLWDKMNQKLNEYVDSVTLEDMVNEYQRNNWEKVPMYYI